MSLHVFKIGARALDMLVMFYAYFEIHLVIYLLAFLPTCVFVCEFFLSLFWHCVRLVVCGSALTSITLMAN